MRFAKFVTQYADYQSQLLPGRALGRTCFRSEPDADIAFDVSLMVVEASFRGITNLAYEARFIHNKIDINQRADAQFSAEITKPPLESVPATIEGYAPLKYH